MTTTTGNAKVDEVTKLRITGNIVPPIWFQTILTASGKPYLLAILILAEIVYWYRAGEKRSETENKTTYYKKFKADLLQLSYSKIEEKFGCTHKQAQAALVALERLGVIKREFRTIYTDGGFKLGNVMYIDMNPSVLEELTYPGTLDTQEDTPMEKNNHRSIPSPAEVNPNSSIDMDAHVQTNTETTTETSTETSTTAVVAQLKKFGLSNHAIDNLIQEANNDISKVYEALDILKTRKNKIKNVPGWLRSAIRDDYQLFAYNNPSQSHSQHFELERQYDFDDLEKKICEGRFHPNNN